MWYGILSNYSYIRTTNFLSLSSTVNSEIFARMLFSRIALKDIFATLTIMRPGQDLPIPVNDRVISPFREGLIFTKLRVCEVSGR